MIELFLFSFLLIADSNPPNKQSSPNPHRAAEIQEMKRQRIEALQNSSKDVLQLLESDNIGTSDLINLEELLNISRHQPMYFAFGNPLTKVQLSFKYLLVKNQPIYFGYSQLMFWDLGEDSKPFRDINYNPEFFYTYIIKNEERFLDSIDIGAWEHNSNGKDGDSSRSFERAYLRFNFEKEFGEVLLRVSPKIGYIYGLDKTNKDIQEYISPLDLRITFVGLFRGMLDKSEFSIRFFPGGKYADNFHKGGFELGLSFRMGGLDINPAFYLQYFNGYAESLINYNERVNEFRAGFIF